MATPIPSNEAPFSIAELVAITGASVLRERVVSVHGVCTDSRAIQPGNAFVALVGERFDGHAHAAEAAAKGARALIVARDVDASLGPAVLRVADTTKALGDLARAHRRRWARDGDPRRRLVAITGSAGKTTTRRAVAALAAGLGRAVHAAEGNLNNAVGIPMVLFGLRPAHDLAVVEVGTSSPGEIAYGGSLSEPDVAVLTLIAVAHTEGLGGLDGVAREKGALFAATSPAGVVVVNADDARAVAALARAPGRRVIRYGTAEGCDVRLVARAPAGVHGATLRITLGGIEVSLRTPLLGIAGAYATLAALATVTALGDPLPGGEALSRALAPLGEDGASRLAPRELEGGTLLLDDSYNANRASVEASIGTAAELAAARGARLVLVLGEMLELGALSASEHDAVAAKVASSGASVVIGVSGDAARIVDLARAASRDTVFVRDASAASDEARARVRPGDVVLVKGSRGVGLEAVVRALAGEDEAAS